MKDNCFGILLIIDLLCGSLDLLHMLVRSRVMMMIMLLMVMMIMMVVMMGMITVTMMIIMMMMMMSFLNLQHHNVC